MPRFRLVIGTILLAGGLFSGCDSAPPKDLPPNIVFICIDTLRGDRIGMERDGELVAPFLTQLSQESVYFPQAETPCSWTRPAMASLFTGLSVYDHGVLHSVRGQNQQHPDSDILPERLETLPEFLAAQGYDTLGVQTNANLTRPLGFAQGFMPDDYHYSNGAIATWVTNQSLAGVTQLQAPFFLYAHYMDPHAPYLPPEEDVALFKQAPVITEEDRWLNQPGRFMKKCFETVDIALGRKAKSDLPDFSENGKEWVRRQYDGETHYTDREIARLVQQVRADHPNTIFIFVSDHGEEFWEHDSIGHGITLYQEQLNVLMMIQAPGLTPRRVEQPVSTLGLFKTLANYLQLPLNPAWQGQDLLQTPLPREAVLSVTLGTWTELGVWAESMRQDKDKLILDHSRAQQLLFDLNQDPLEQTNLFGQQVETGAALYQQLIKRYENVWPTLQQRSSAQSIPLTDAMREALDAIGYIQDQ